MPSSQVLLILPSIARTGDAGPAVAEVGLVGDPDALKVRALLKEAAEVSVVWRQLREDLAAVAHHIRPKKRDKTCGRAYREDLATTHQSNNSKV